MGKQKLFAADGAFRQKMEISRVRSAHNQWISHGQCWKCKFCFQKSFLFWRVFDVLWQTLKYFLQYIFLDHVVQYTLTTWIVMYITVDYSQIRGSNAVIVALYWTKLTWAKTRCPFTKRSSHLNLLLERPEEKKRKIWLAMTDRTYGSLRSVCLAFKFLNLN